MDLRLEPRLSDGGEHDRRSRFSVPTVDWDRTTPMLTMEDRRHAQRQAAPRSISAAVSTARIKFSRHALRGDFFHADIHPGNLFSAIPAAGRWIWHHGKA
jgi:predicted unusual protein kinase regulating ubiquinone biosynthesis (AarF/ABC1/UbiB family)